jgi:trigger factor
MNITIEERPGRQAVITVEVDTERMEQAIEDAWRRVLPRVVVPGFRKGKAPRPLVERMVGREAILDEAIDDLLPTVWQEVLAEKGNDL